MNEANEERIGADKRTYALTLRGALFVGNLVLARE